MAARTEPLEQWMRTYGPAVLGLARRMLRDAHAAEDVFQATFVKAYCRALPFRDDGHTRAWLLRVAANDCLSRLRSPWRRSVTLMDTLSGAEPPGYPGLHEALDRLPPRYGDAVRLHYLAGYDTDEIAELTGIPAATVRTRLARARHRLRGMLDRGDFLEE